MFSNIYKINFYRRSMEKSAFISLILIFIFSLNGVYAQGNETVNQTAMDNSSIIAPPSLDLINFMPKEVKLGDVQFNLQIQNNKNETVNNTFAFITGDGFSTYNVIPINSLASGEKDYLFVYGNLKQTGNITLTITINDETFYQNISVISDTSNQQKLDELQQEQEKEQQIKNISDQLNGIKQNFTLLQNEFSEKQSNYDLSLINLNTLDNYIHNVQADILTGNVNDANLNLNLAYDEYLTQKNNLDNAKGLPLVSIIKNNVVLFSTFAGAILTFFALYELLKKKKEDIRGISKKIIEKKEEEK